MQKFDKVHIEVWFDKKIVWKGQKKFGKTRKKFGKKRKKFDKEIHSTNNPAQSCIEGKLIRRPEVSPKKIIQHKNKDDIYYCEK